MSRSERFHVGALSDTFGVIVIVCFSSVVGVSSDIMLLLLLLFAVVEGSVAVAGGGGLQLFVDSNMSVDSALIRQLVSEVLTEQVALLLGQRESLDPEPEPPEPGPGSREEVRSFQSSLFP